MTSAGPVPPAPPALARRLGLRDATLIGVGSMVGAGVFVAPAPAAAVAGSWLLVALGLAAVVAYANATSSAQLAAQYPSAGGTYVYGRERLGEWWGFLAGWSFVVGKTASCAAMALAVAAYVVPGGWERPAAALVVVVLVAVNCRGVTRTAQATRVIVAVVLVALAVLVVTGLAAGSPAADRLALPGLSGLAGSGPDVSAYDVLQAAGLLFFAFAGYARIATLGEEVRDPARTIPRAVSLALGTALVVYALVTTTLLLVLGADGVAATPEPVAALARATGIAGLEPLARGAAALAATGALLALVAGVGRTSLAMARTGDLPRPLAAVHPTYAVPHTAELVVGAVVVVLVLTTDLRGAIGFSSAGVLTYYLVANLAAWTQTDEHRRYPRALQAVGVIGCVVLVATLPVGSVVGGLAVLAVGVAYRAVVVRRAPQPLL